MSHLQDLEPTSGCDVLRGRWLAQLARWVAHRPVADHPGGLAQVRDELHDALRALGFTVTAFALKGAQPVLVATRAPRAGGRWVGLFGHYDCEQAGSGWSADPFTLRLHDGRIYGRGVADNLGPLLLRLAALADRLQDPAGHAALPGLVWVLQGEEEIGSPFAHQVYPTLTLPAVALWLEETGYFEADGAQRLLLRRPSPLVDKLAHDLAALAATSGRALARHDRYLNKAFGEHRCPCLSHLVGDRSYVAIGPNDTRSRIHAADESLPLATFALSVQQFLYTLSALATPAGAAVDATACA